MSRISNLVEGIARPVVEANGCTLWDVEYTKEAGSMYLRVFIDKPEGVSIQDCENISRMLDPILDEKDFISESYIFEVCSAGADRLLKKPSDFYSFYGHKVDVSLYKPIESKKAYTGVLTAYSEDGLVIDTGEQTLTFDLSSVAQVRLHIDF